MIVERTGLEAEEAAVDPVLAPRLLAKAAHAPSSVHLGDPELQLGPDDRHRGEPALGAVEVDQADEIDVGHPVGIGGAERALAEQRPGLFDPPPGRCVHAGVEAAHLHAVGPSA